MSLSVAGTFFHYDEGAGMGMDPSSWSVKKWPISLSKWVSLAHWSPFFPPNVIFLPMKVLVIANWNGTLKSEKVVEILKNKVSQFSTSTRIFRRLSTLLTLPQRKLWQVNYGLQEAKPQNFWLFNVLKTIKWLTMALKIYIYSIRGYDSS